MAKRKGRKNLPAPAKNLTAALKGNLADGAKVTAPASPSKNIVSPKPEAAEEFEFISTSRSRQKLTRIAEALRGEGFDEAALGRAYVKLVRKLLAGKKASGNDKLLVDVLKEISRTLEPPNPGGAGSPSASDGPVIVQLLHEVPRPVRNQPGDAPAETSANTSGNSSSENAGDMQHSRPSASAFEHRQTT